MKKRTLLLLGLASLAACGGDGSTNLILPPVNLEVIIVIGDSQVGQVHAELPDPIVVRALNDDSTPRPGQIINFVVVSGGGSVFAGAGVTDAQGFVRERWTLGDTAGIQALEARAVDSLGNKIMFAQIVATATPGPVDTLLLATTDTTVFVGERLRLTALVTEARDAYGNTVSSPTLAFSGPARWNFAGDSGWSATEARDTIAVQSGAAISRIRASTVIDLRTPAWRFSWTCRNSSVATRGVENPPAGMDTLIVGLAIDSLNYAGDPGYRSDAYFGRAQLWFTGTAERFWRDGVRDTVTLATEILVVLAQIPDTIQTTSGVLVRAVPAGPYEGIAPQCSANGFIGPNDPRQLATP